MTPSPYRFDWDAVVGMNRNVSSTGLSEIRAQILHPANRILINVRRVDCSEAIQCKAQGIYTGIWIEAPGQLVGAVAEQEHLLVEVAVWIILLGEFGE